MTVTFDRFSRSQEDIAANFSHFGAVDCPPLGAKIYETVCRDAQDDPDLLDMAAHAPATQPPVNLLFAAVHYLLLSGESHALRQWYPELSDGPANPYDSVFSPFRDFCLAHRTRIEELIETRRVQTNVLQRCSFLLPGIAEVFSRGGGRPLALIEIGASAGLNLHFDRFSFHYSDGTTWGDANASLRIESDLRGPGRLPAFPEVLPVAWRRGIDLHPIDLEDPDEVLWLRSLAWPDHPGRQERLTQAIAISREHPNTVLEGDASRSLSNLLREAPEESTLCVYGTHTLYQFERDDLVATLSSMQKASTERTLHFLSAESTAAPDAELFWTVYEDGGRSTQRLARCCPHGRWLEYSPPRSGA